MHKLKDKSLDYLEDGIRLTGYFEIILKKFIETKFNKLFYLYRKS